MACRYRFCVLVLGLMVSGFSGRALAENEGQADLDQATQRKLSATTLADLGEVIRLCESAQKKGLDATNTSFAKNLLASALVQRGLTVAIKVYRDLLSDGNWQQARKEALDDLERGLQVTPKQPQALYQVARLNLLPGGDAKRAAEALDQTIALSEEEPPLRAEALVLRASTQKDPLKRLHDLDEAVRVAPGDASVLRARGIVRAETDKLTAALDDLDAALKIDPKQLPTYQIKALVLVKQKKYAEALAVLEQARAIAPDNLDLPMTKARIHVQLADYKSALAELEGALAKEPENLSLLVLRAGIYQEMGDKAKALADIERILKVKPRLPGAMRDRAVLLADLGKFDEALSQLEQLRQANPKDPITLLQLALLHSAKKDYAKSVEMFSAFLAEQPNEWMGYRGRGDALLTLGRRAEALNDYNKALELRPNDVGVLNNLAWVLATAPEQPLRNGGRAVTLATQACKLTEYKQDYILSTLAAAYAESGDFAAAQQWIAKAIAVGTPQHLESLKKEQVSYQARKPWREALPEDDETKPAAKETPSRPEAKQPAAGEKQPSPLPKTRG